MRLFYWRNELRKGSKKRTTLTLVLLFLIGAVMFIWPLISEVTSYQVDDEEYGTLSEQIHAPETGPEINSPSAPSEAVPIETEPSEERLDSDALSFEEEPVTLPAEKAQTVTPFQGPEATLSPFEHHIPISTQNTPQTESLPVGQSDSMRVPAAAAPQSTDRSSPIVPSAIEPPTGADLAACLAQNRDFVAWITIPGTVIDYPVVRSDNTEYYLHHLFNGKQSKLGTLFSLRSSDYRTPSRNIAIFGHHLSHSKAMFSTLLNYKNFAWYTTHSEIHLDTLFGSRDYQIFAVINMKVSEWDAATAVFANNDSFLSFVNRARQRSLYETGVQVTAADHILTLITCDREYASAQGRLVVMAVELKKTEKGNERT